MGISTVRENSYFVSRVLENSVASFDAVYKTAKMLVSDIEVFQVVADRLGCLSAPLANSLNLAQKQFKVTVDFLGLFHFVSRLGEWSKCLDNSKEGQQAWKKFWTDASWIKRAKSITLTVGNFFLSMKILGKWGVLEFGRYSRLAARVLPMRIVVVLDPQVWSDMFILVSSILGYIEQAKNVSNAKCKKAIRAQHLQDNRLRYNDYRMWRNLNVANKDQFLPKFQAEADRKVAKLDQKVAGTLATRCTPARLQQQQMVWQQVSAALKAANAADPNDAAIAAYKNVVNANIHRGVTKLAIANFELDKARIGRSGEFWKGAIVSLGLARAFFGIELGFFTTCVAWTFNTVGWWKAVKYDGGAATAPVLQ